MSCETLIEANWKCDHCPDQEKTDSSLKVPKGWTYSEFKISRISIHAADSVELDKKYELHLCEKCSVFAYSSDVASSKLIVHRNKFLKILHKLFGDKDGENK